MEKKIPKISNGDLLEVIEQYDTKHYNKRVSKMQHNIEKFALHRKTQLKQMLQEPEKYHPVIYKLLSACKGSEIMDIPKWN